MIKTTKMKNSLDSYIREQNASVILKECEQESVFS
jgi:hypothetical protein